MTQGAAATAYEQHKRSYLDTERDCAAQGISFIPIVAEASGGWGPSALCTFKALAKLAQQGLQSVACEELPNPRFRRHLEHACTAIRRANARAVLRRAVGSAGPTDDAMNSAHGILEGEDVGT